MSHDDPLSRRRFLGQAGAAVLLGTSALAGCSALPLGDRIGQTEPIPGDRLREVAGRDAPEVPETLPVGIEGSYLTSAADSARADLSSVPTPFDRGDIPNGAIRRKLADVRDRAEAMLDSAETAPAPFEALRTLRRARGEARTLSAAWEAIEEDTTREQVARRAPPIEDDLTDFVGRWRYVGEDPVRAAIVHATLEGDVRSTKRAVDADTDAFERAPENPITVGELAGDLERARARVDDVSHLYDRYRASLDDPTDLRSALERSADSLVDDVQRRRRGIPTVEPDDHAELVGRDVSGTPAAEALEHLYWRLDDPGYAREERDAGRPAHAVVVGHSVIARFRAFGSLRERVAEGESFTIETASDVGSIRAEAVDAVESARAANAYPALANRDLARLARRLRNADDQIARLDGSVRPASLEYEVAEYVLVGEIANALPPTSEQVASTLRSA